MITNSDGLWLWNGRLLGAELQTYLNSPVSERYRSRKENPMIYWVAAVTECEDAEVVVYDLIVAKTAEDAILRFSLEHADFLKAYPTARVAVRPF